MNITIMILVLWAGFTLGFFAGSIWSAITWRP